ncbi:putative electron transport protein YccM [bioreactor metagenome]|uniref:Putative electron transport protein YccM n=1 Tax=bioreactor metagenome TaxID=1076179 RepID=A0A645C7P8_9ZZZZ
MPDKKIKASSLRKVVQISVFILVALIAVGKWLAEKGTVIPFFSEMSLHGVCPFGGVVTLNELFTEGTFIQKIHSSSVVLMVLGFIVAILFGNIFCGYICPFGTFQEWLGGLGRKLFPKKYNHMVPEKLDRALRYLRYGVLGLVVVETAAVGKLVFQSVDPYYALFNFFTGEVALTAFAVLAAVMLLSLIIERPWCRYFCPYGALLGLFNTLRIFKLRRNTHTCIGCKQCDRACPMNIKVSESGIVRDPSCISCHKCLSAVTCPVADTVVIASGKEREEGSSDPA